jgi:SAM-dependent methyltransferase
VCGSTSARPLLDLPYDAAPLDRYLRVFYAGRLDPERLAGNRYRLVACEACGLAYQRDVPDPSFLAELYGELIDETEAELQQRRGLAVRQAYASQVEQAIAFWGRPPTELEVLDFGAGAGMWLRFARAYGCRTTAVELTAGDAVEGADRVLATADLPGATFHYANAEQVFEHLVDPVEELRRIARSLRPGGIVRVAVPSSVDLDRALAAADWAAPKGSPTSLNAVAPLEHLNCYRGTSLARLGQEAGLTPFRYPLRLQLDPRARPADLVEAMRSRVRRSTPVAYFRNG